MPFSEKAKGRGQSRARNNTPVGVQGGAPFINIRQRVTDSSRAVSQLFFFFFPELSLPSRNLNNRYSRDGWKVTKIGHEE
jgi:hypothetical protein